MQLLSWSFSILCVRVVSLMMLFLALLIPAEPTFAGDYGRVTGSFTSTQPPAVDKIEIFDAKMQTPSSLNPLQSYLLRITINNPVGISGLKELEVKLWLDDTNTREKHQEDDFDYDNRSEYDATKSRIQFHWDKRTNTFHLDYDHSTLWQITQINYPDPEDTGTAYAFDFYITVSKTAEEAASGKVWQIGARIRNDGEKTSYMYYGDDNPGIPMNWYGEVIVPSQAAVNWGRLPAGTNFADAAAHKNVDKELKFYANGRHVYKVKSSTVWTRQGGGTPMTLSADASQPNTFALQAAIGTSTLSKKALEAGGTYVSLKENANTGDYGVTLPSSENHLYLKLSNDILPGVYSGQLTFAISNP